MTSFATAGYYTGRAIQVGLGFVALVLLLGSLQMNIIRFMAIGMFALVLFGFAGLLEWIVVRPLARRRPRGEPDAE